MGMVTLISTILWVSVSIYQALVSPAEIGVDNNLLSPISPQIDQVTVASISGRTQIGEGALILVTDLPVVTDLPAASGSDSASSSAEIVR